MTTFLQNSTMYTALASLIPYCDEWVSFALNDCVKWPAILKIIDGFDKWHDAKIEALSIVPPELSQKLSAKRELLWKRDVLIWLSTAKPRYNGRHRWVSKVGPELYFRRAVLGKTNEKKDIKNWLQNLNEPEDALAWARLSSEIARNIWSTICPSAPPQPPQPPQPSTVAREKQKIDAERENQEAEMDIEKIFRLQIKLTQQRPSRSSPTNSKRQKMAAGPSLSLCC